MEAVTRDASVVQPVSLPSVLGVLDALRDNRLERPLKILVPPSSVTAWEMPSRTDRRMALCNHSDRAVDMAHMTSAVPTPPPSSHSSILTVATVHPSGAYGPSSPPLVLAA